MPEFKPDVDYGDLLAHLSDGLYFVDRNRRITFWNPAAERITGFSAAEVLGRSCSENILMHVDGKGCQLCTSDCPLSASIGDGAAHEAEVYLRTSDGRRLPVWVRVTPMRDDAGAIVGAVELFTDMSSRAQIEVRLRELERIALLDQLTEIPNRRHIEAEVRAHLEEAERYGVPFGLLFLDVDHFKAFNDQHGHDAGDAILKTVAGTLLLASRPFDSFGRWGGEEFVGIIRNVDGPALGATAERLRMLISQSCAMFEGKQLSATVSVGATLHAKGDTLESMVKRADALMYRSKSSGRNRVSLG